MDMISSNIYLFYEILEYLHIEDLLNVAKVSTGFRSAVMGLLKTKYKIVEAYKTYTNFIVKNKISNDFDCIILNSNNENFIIPKREKRILLDHEEFYEFINLIAINIETLFVDYAYNYQYGGCSGDYYEDRDYFTKIKFNELKRINFGILSLTKEQINNIIKNCINIEEIYCKRILPEQQCINEKNEEDMEDIPMAINTSNLMNIMHKLGYIDVHFTLPRCKHYPKQFWQKEHLQNQLYAPRYVVNMLIDKNNTNVKTFKTKPNDFQLCKILTEGQLIDATMFDKFNLNDLSNLIYLRKLIIITTSSFFKCNETFFNILSHNCQHLELLEMHFCLISNFVAITSLKQLIFYNCSTLTADNLKSILCEHPNLQSFSATTSVFEGKCLNNKICLSNKISPNLQHIELRYNRMDYKLMSVLNLNNLTSLHWSSIGTDNQEWINSNNCPKLLTLEINTNSNQLKQLNKFKFLKKLIINVDDDLTAEDFWNILQHPTIIYLSLQTNYNCNDMNYDNYLMCSIENVNIWKLNMLRFIDVCFIKDCKAFFDFWFILLTRNKNLSIRIKYRCIEEEYIFEFDSDDNDACEMLLTEILKNPNRPESLKTINICGINVGMY